MSNMSFEVIDYNRRLLDIENFDVSNSADVSSLLDTLFEISYSFIVFDDIYNDNASFTNVEEGLERLISVTFYEMNKLFDFASFGRGVISLEMTVLLRSYMSMFTSYLDSFFGFAKGDEECKYNTLMGMSDDNIKNVAKYKRIYDSVLYFVDTFEDTIVDSSLTPSEQSLISTDVRLLLTGVAYKRWSGRISDFLKDQLVYETKQELLKFPRNLEAVEDYLRIRSNKGYEPVLPVLVLDYIK